MVKLGSYKIIDGKPYAVFRTNISKGEAKKSAKQLRGNGWKARVLKTNSGWTVYQGQRR